MKTTILSVTTFILAVMLSTAITIAMLQVVEAAVIVLALGAGYYVLSAQGLSWNRISYSIRLFVYRQLS